MKPLLEYIFHEIGGMWRDIAYPEQRVLADVLKDYDIIVDDRCQFARLYDYERMIYFYYRASAGKVTLTLWRIR